MSGAKIVQGLRDAVAGNFASVMVEDQMWVRRDWQPIETAPRDGSRILAIYGGQTRVMQFGKTSHVPLYGFCLADQGPEDFDLIQEAEIGGWQPLPTPPQQRRG